MVLFFFPAIVMPDASALVIWLVEIDNVIGFAICFPTIEEEMIKFKKFLFFRFKKKVLINQSINLHFMQLQLFLP
jgi:hypothetical protein